MWAADNDGDPVEGEFIEEPTWTCDYGLIRSAQGVNGVLYLDYPRSSVTSEPILSYNWWSGYVNTTKFDFGPRRKDNYRDFQTGGTGQPWGDANRYYIMSNGETDYDMVYSAAITPTDPVWITPPPEIALVASTEGLPTGPPNLLSVGPYEIPPGLTISFPFAFVCAENFHTDPANGGNLPGQLDRFYGNLDFTDLVQNATWAKWTYDNPGYDTDGNGYSGEAVYCDGDSVYYTGDGIPDWRSALPPPAPVFWLEPTVCGLRVRFNGTMSETAVDLFSSDVEFEGYRVYCGLDQRRSSMALVASFDREDFDKYVWNGDIANPKFSVLEPPFTSDSLRCLYGSTNDPCQDTSFQPMNFTSSNFFFHPDFKDSIFYFTPHDHNAFELGVTTPIQKVYPDEPKPNIHQPDSIPADAYTCEGYLKYYEYEIVIEQLLPTIPYWVNVTAFDYGEPNMGLKGLESPLTTGSKSAYPYNASDASAGGNNQVYVYPNPYRGDANYRDLGLEGRTEEDRPDYRVRAINFANLPAKCTIYIYSLDGDLVRRLDHDMDPSDPNSSHDSWNMITRNTQMVVSGLYYWVVEAEDGSSQMGKLVIIM